MYETHRSGNRNSKNDFWGYIITQSLWHSFLGFLKKKYTFQFHGKKGGQSVVCILHFWNFSYFLLPTSSSIKSAYKYTYTYLWVIVLHNKEFGSNASIRCRARRCSHFSQGFHYSVQSWRVPLRRLSFQSSPACRSSISTAARTKTASWGGRWEWWWNNTFWRKFWRSGWVRAWDLLFKVIIVVNGRRGNGHGQWSYSSCCLIC